MIGTVAFAGCVMALASGCSSGTNVSAVVQRTGSPSAGVSPTTTPSQSQTASIAPSPTYIDLETAPPAKSGGSSVQVQAPCDSGTVTLNAYPDGQGVAMIATLRHVNHTTWGVYTAVPPYNGTGGEPILVNHRAPGGKLVIHANNLTGPRAVTGVSHAWPQSAEVDLSPKTARPVQCNTTAYLGNQEAHAVTNNLDVRVARGSGTLRLRDRDAPVGGAWQVSVTVRSPDGVQHETQTVAAKAYTDGIIGYNFFAKLGHLTDLHDFTSVTVLASEDGKHRTWLTLSRTP